MGTYGWGKESPLDEWLYAEGHKFEFFQAVKLLEILHPERIPVGEGSDPSKIVVQFKGKTGLEFPASEVQHVRPPRARNTAAEMHTNVMSLAGNLGPLPHTYTELLLERLKYNDRALSEFLNIFNHRLISLLYRARKKTRIGFDFKPPDQDQFHNYLFSLMGMNTPGLQNRLKVNDRALLFYTGLFALHPKSMAGLERVLSDYFQVPVKGIQNKGKWYRLEDDQVTHIGRSGKNRTLGKNTLLGSKVWDQERTFRILVGPLTFKQFTNLLPINKGFAPLCEMVRLHSGDEFDFEIQLKLKSAEVPASRLSSRNGPYLGWTSYLKTGWFAKDDSQVVLSPEYSNPATATAS